MANLDRLGDAQRLASDGIKLTLVDAANVGHQRRLEVAHRRHIAQVVLLLVRSGDQVGAAFERLVENH